MGGRLVEKKQISFLQNDLIGVVYDVRGRAAAHIDQLGIVVAVLWKMREACMGTDLNQMTALQKLGVIYHEFLTGGVDFLLDVGMPLQKGFFLGSDLPQVA